MRGKLISLSLSAALAFSLTACGGGGGGSAGGEETPTTVEVPVESNNFSYALTSVYSGVEQTQRGTVSSREVKIYTGELLATNVDSGDSKTFNWSAYVNDETFEVTSNKTVVLEPGNYEFTLNLTDGTHQYISETVYEVQDTDQINIPFNLKPIIGNIITDVTVVEEIPAMKLKYDIGEISAYSNPRVAIGIDGGDIQYLDINPETGLSDVYLSIDSGEHNISLDFYDGNSYLGKSSQYPAEVTIEANQDLNLDLVALHGEATLGFDVNESTLDLVVNIPSQVVVESEGIDNLGTLLRYTDSNVTIEKEISTLVENGSNYQGSITLEDISYGEFAFSLEFTDKSDNDELIGSCDVEPFTLSENNTSVNCDLSLKKRSNITGNLLATVGVNVFNETMEPVAGASIYIDDDYLGLSGSGTFGTEGYLKQYIKKGSYSLRAEKDNMKGTQEVNLSTLSINNFDLILDTPISMASCKEILDSGNSTGSGSYLIDPDGNGGNDPFNVYCDMSTNGGGWTLITKASNYNSTPTVSGPVLSDELPTDLTPLSRITNEDVKYSLWSLFKDLDNIELMVKVQGITFKHTMDKSRIGENTKGYSFSGYSGITCLSGNCPNVNQYTLIDQQNFSVLRIGEFHYSPRVTNYFWGYESAGWGSGAGGSGGASFWIR